MTELLIPQHALRPQLCLYDTIEADRADALPPTIRAIKADRLDVEVLAQAIALTRDGAKVVQIETPPISDELRAFSEQLLRDSAAWTMQKETKIMKHAAPHQGRHIQGETLQTLFARAGANIDDYFAAFGMKDSDLARDWKAMQLASVEVVENLVPEERLAVHFRRGFTDLKSMLSFHPHSSFSPNKKGFYLNFTQGEIGTWFPDDRDCVINKDGNLYFTTETPRIWASQTYNAHTLFTLSASGQVGGHHSIPCILREGQDLRRETQSVEFCCDPAALPG